MNFTLRLSVFFWLAVLPMTCFAVTIDVTVNAGPNHDAQTATSGSLMTSVSAPTGLSIATGAIDDTGTDSW
jgi:hypothetical protein